MYKTKQTDIFSKWLKKLKDIQGKVSILRRISRAEEGNAEISHLRGTI